MSDRVNSKEESSTVSCPKEGIKKGEGKAHPITGHEGPEGSRGIALLFP